MKKLWLRTPLFKVALCFRHIPRRNITTLLLLFFTIY